MTTHARNAARTNQRPRPSRADRPSQSSTAVHIPQYRLPAILAIWAAAAGPMAGAAWVLAPRAASSSDGPGSFTGALLICLTAGLAWQFLLVLILVGREQHSLRWAVLRDALWLRAPRDVRSGRAGGRLWLVVLALAILFAARQLLPHLPVPIARDLGAFLRSEPGQTFLDGAWGWFALIVLMGIFNTVLGEELLFRGFLLPRMNGAFGRADWVANGVLFAAYHVHVPWAIPGALLDTLLLAYPTKRYRSALIGIAVHSTQTVFFMVVVLPVVL